MEVFRKSWHLDFRFPQVQAVDYDPPDHGGKINYSFVSSAKERIKFTIDQETGRIQTKTVSELSRVEKV